MKVDIISLSWSLRDKYNIVAPILNWATSRGVVVLAATHNEGANEGISFPASMSNVLCIGAANGKGGIPHSTPLRGKAEKFSALGVAVEGSWINQKEMASSAKYILMTRQDGDSTLEYVYQAKVPDISIQHESKERRTGSSTATAIAAGIAALCLDYIRQFKSPEPSKRAEYIRTLFLKMSGATRTQPYQYLTPWLLLDGQITTNPIDRWRKVEAILQRTPGMVLVSRR